MALSETTMLHDDDLQKIYLWIDSIPLSRPKRNIARDFSDGVLMAEVVAHYFPKYVELHNYSAANSLRQKLYNWSTLNQKVFKRLDGFEVKKADVEGIVNCKPGVIELILFALQQKITDLRARKAAGEQTSPHDSGVHGGGASGRDGFSHSSLGAAPVARALHAGEGFAGAAAGASSAATMAPVSARSNLSAPVAHAAAAPPMAAHAHMTAAAGSSSASASAIDAAVMAEKDATIAELRETIEIQELKIRKLEQLVKLKDQRIQTLTARLQTVPGIGGGMGPQ